MKRITTIIFLLAGFLVQAQYELTVLNEGYDNLEDTTSLNNGEIWDDPSFTIPIGFDFQLGPNVVDTIFISDESTGGLPTTIDDINAAPFGAFAPVLQDIVDRGATTGISLSPISFKLEGEAGSQIFKLEWNNVGFVEEETLQDFMNFQLWLYEEGNIVEYRYGPNEINDPNSSFEDLDGIQVALLPLLTAEGGEPLEDAYVLSGDPLNPDFIVLSTTDDFDNAENISLTGAIPDGTVYRFSPEALGIDNAEGESIGFKMFPNPANEILTIDSKGVDYELEIYNISGQRVMKSDSSQNTHNISNLSNGVYVVKIESETGVDTKRLIKA